MSDTQLVPAEQVAEAELLSQLDPDHLPRHVAIIMDGNGRWAAVRGLPRIAGHREGLNALRDVLDVLHELGVQVVTIYAFSYENWTRPESEISMLMSLLKEYLQQERNMFLEKKIRFLPIGRLDKLPHPVQRLPAS